MLAEILGLFALAAAPAPADVQEIQVRDTKVVVRADSPWPKAVNKGWLPIFVQIENGEDEPQRVRLSGSCWGVSREITATVDVGARQTSSIELLVPAFANTNNGVRLRVDVGGGHEYSSTNLGADDYATPECGAVLVLAEELPPAGTPERWSGEVSTKVVQGGRRVYARGGVLTTIGYSSSVPAGTAPNDICVQAARFDQMPGRSEAYSSLDVVVLDLSRGLPEARRLAPLIAWARLGGSLLLAGADAEAQARTVPELASWMEERFAADPSSSFTSGRGELNQGWRLGLGLLTIHTASWLVGPGQRDLLRELVDSSRPTVEENGSSRMFPFSPVVPDLFALPLKAFSLFLICFAILIGPVNFILVKRTKRPAILLVSIPAIAIAAALLLFVFGIASQGLGIKVASETLVLLDQREHRASAAEVRMVFAGLSPGAALVPRPGSSCYAIGTYQTDGELERLTESSRTFRIDQTDGLALSGQFIPSRTAFLQEILSDHAERARLAVQKRGQSFAIENGLGTTIKSLYLRDASGGYHHLAAELASGGTAELTPAGGAGSPQGTDSHAYQHLRTRDGALPAGSYFALLERNPFGDDCGVSGEEVEGTHYLYGVLALDGEEWR